MSADRMTNAEAVILCRFAKACCPQQQFDSYTPDAWFELLRDLRFEDCKEAVVAIVKRQPFVAPAEIRDEIQVVRINRFKRFSRKWQIEPPARLADDPTAEVEWRRTVERAIYDGAITHPDQIEDRGQVMFNSALIDEDGNEIHQQRDVIAELGQIGRAVPDA